MNLKQIIFLLLPYFFCNACNHEFEDPNTWKAHGDEIAEMLKKTDITDHKPMKIALEEQGKKIEFDGEVFLVTLKNGIKAVFQSLPLDDQGDAITEVAAYQASRALGFPHIPPTVLREIDSRKGSLQLFVDTPIDLLGDGEFKKAFSNFSKEDIDNLLIFYFVLGQWDVGAHNLLAYRYRDHFISIVSDIYCIKTAYGLWVQYHAFDPEHKTFFTSLPKTCATATYKALAKLDKALLKRIFAYSADPTCFPEAHLEVILERCKQVLNFCKPQDGVGVTN